MIRVLVVEDSAVVRQLLVHILKSDPEIEIAGTAADGEEALIAVEQTRPSVITMDIHMPGMNGFDVARRIMERRPTPIVIVSGALDPHETTSAFQTLDSGALAILLKPVGIGSPEFERTAAELVRTVKVMSEVKVVRRWAKPGRTHADYAKHLVPAASPVVKHVCAVAIGASTGGPQVIQTILSHLPGNFPVPIFAVQHIASGFTTGFVDWLSQSSKLPVHVATHREMSVPGHVYLAPDAFHLKVGPDRRLLLTEDEPENGLRPSVSTLFRSVAEVYGGKSVAVLLSGMGRDGAQELKLLKDLGATTIAQDRESSVVHGMPGEAIRLGGTTYVLSQEKIAPALTSLVCDGG